MFRRLLRPTTVAYAHCDIPCGIYDPTPAKIAADTVAKMVEKINAIPKDAITTIPLDIPVERNTIKGFLAADLMGISAAVGTGTLPLRQVGPSNIFNEPIGNSRAGAFYPRIGTNPNDSGGGRRQ